MVGCGVARGVFYAFQLRCFATASAAPQNQANCNAQKFAWCVAMCYAGLVAKAPTTPHRFEKTMHPF